MFIGFNCLLRLNIGNFFLHNNSLKNKFPKKKIYPAVFQALKLTYV